MSRPRLRRALWAVPAVAVVGLSGATAALAQTEELATIQVSKTEIAEGETITIMNTDDDTSRCEGGIVVIFVGGAPISAEYNQLVVFPDENGDWSTTWTSPVQAEWSNAYVGGPFTFEAICTEDTFAESTAVPQATPEFDYEPVVVSIVAEVPDTTETPTSEAPAAAEAAAVTPSFTG